ncbi:MAG: spermidine/putrescine ABC transporter substrate-binding protein [Clostridia bacterium]|nr:spermidine/putrescine ABC transporter substrate-binding protein [Clostridia bacterium]
MTRYVLIITVIICSILLFGCNLARDEQDIVKKDAAVHAQDKSKADEKNKSAEVAAEVVVLNWADYIPESVFVKFQERYGIKVRQVNFSSEEEMKEKLEKDAGKFDVTVANGGLIPVLIKSGQVQPINLKNIPNIRNVGKEYLDKTFDRGNKYSVPFTLGYSGIIVNTDKVKEPITSYADLWNPRFVNSISFAEDSRTIIGVVLKKMGYSANETDKKVLEKARKEVLKLRRNVKVINSDANNRAVAKGEASIGFLWSSEVVYNQVDNPKVKMIFPKEGLIVFQDNFLILKDAPHKQLGEKFINFILEPEISAEVTRLVPYATTNIEAYKYMDKSILQNKSIYLPLEEVERAEHVNNNVNPDIQDIYDSIWREFTQQ